MVPKTIKELTCNNEQNAGYSTSEQRSAVRTIIHMHKRIGNSPPCRLLPDDNAPYAGKTFLFHF